MRTQCAAEAIRTGCGFLTHSPFSCRKAPPGDNSFARELLIPLGSSGYVALLEIVDAGPVIVGTIKHQHEDDYR